MLVLARKSGESVLINGNIRITVDCIRRRVVQLRIDAPAEIRVDREEVWRRRTAESHAMESQSHADDSSEEPRHGVAPEDAPLAWRT